MSWLGNLRIHTKFNLIMSLLLIFLFMAAATLTYQRQKSLIIKLAVENARSFAKQIIETRNYMSDVVKEEPEENYALVPQVVATQVAKRITAGSPYYVRQVSLRNRNPDNHPDEYESGLLRQFSTTRTTEAYNVVSVKGERVFRYLQPMLAVESCLGCHGDYDKAPRFVKARFPKGHDSYNYHIGEVIGAVSVSIPMVDLYREIGTNLKHDLLVRGGIFFLIIAVMGMALRKNILDPIKMLSESLIRVTRTGSFTDRLPQRTNDEIGQLMASFNNMMEELDRKTIQSSESEERYRRVIDLLHSAVITFMQNGKILVTNQKAEELIGHSRQDLLGESLFDFLVDGNALREHVASLMTSPPTRTVTRTFRQKVRSLDGTLTDVEIQLFASQTGPQPLFTAILRITP